jgi:hypothetical protein
VFHADCLPALEILRSKPHAPRNEGDTAAPMLACGGDAGIPLRGRPPTGCCGGVVRKAHPWRAQNKKANPKRIGQLVDFAWRRGPESNRPTRICNPVHNRFATAPCLVYTKKGSDPNFPFSKIWSGKPVSNRRPQPWQGCALPTELFPRIRYGA